MGWRRTPNNLRDFFDNWLPLNDSKYNLKLYSLAMVLWVLWNVRNKTVIEGVFLADPTDAFLFKIHAYLQRWRGRPKPEDGEQMTTESTEARESAGMGGGFPGGKKGADFGIPSSVIE
jgi:hypothetical protein